MGDQESATSAATGMRYLSEELTAMRPRHIAAAPRATRVHGEPPCDIDILDHLRSTRADLIEATRILLAGELNPDLPRPPHDEGIFQWMVEATAHLDEDKQRIREAITYTKLLEQKVLSGDRLAVRTHRCPACRCLSLMWRRSIGRAVCIQDECLDELGRASQWDLRQIAHYHVTSRPQRAAN